MDWRCQGRSRSDDKHSLRQPRIKVDGQNEPVVNLPNQGDELNVRSSKTTRNYEIDRSVRHVKNHGTVEKISVAVVVNEDLLIKGEVTEPASTTNEDSVQDGEAENQIPANQSSQQERDARIALEVDRLTTLVKGLLDLMKKEVILLQ